MYTCVLLSHIIRHNGSDVSAMPRAISPTYEPLALGPGVHPILMAQVYTHFWRARASPEGGIIYQDLGMVTTHLDQRVITSKIIKMQMTR